MSDEPLTSDEATDLETWLRADGDDAIADRVAEHAGQECEICRALYEMMSDQ
jgi:hypothetical protein